MEDVTTMWEDPVEERRKRIREGDVGSQAVEGQLAMELVRPRVNMKTIQIG